MGRTSSCGNVCRFAQIAYVNWAAKVVRVVAVKLAQDEWEVWAQVLGAELAIVECEFKIES